MDELKSYDQLAAQIVQKFRDASEGYPTLTKITACYNIMIGLLNLCAVQGAEEDLVKLADEFHFGMMQHIYALYPEENE